MTILFPYYIHSMEIAICIKLDFHTISNEDPKFTE